MMRCPRCQVQLRHSEMVKHLWLAHRLMLEGTRVREPWALVEEQIARAARTGNAAELARCIDLGPHIDPEKGADRVQELLRQYGVTPWSVLAAVQCPHCRHSFETARPEPAPLERTHGRWFGDGYSVEVGDGYGASRLTIATPRETVWNGPEPGRRFSDRGLRLLLTGLPIALALLLAIGFRLGSIASVGPVVFLLLVAVGIHGWLRWGVQVREPPPIRAIDHAWARLVPHLLSAGWAGPDLDFTVRLALVSVGQGNVTLRETILARLLPVVEAECATDGRRWRDLALLWRLALSDATQQGRDAVLLILNLLDRGLRGELPLIFLDHLLAGWQSPLWTVGTLARLRVLLAERAFEAGLEVADLVELGQRIPALGDVLHIDRIEELAALRWLKSVQPSRPWERIGLAATVFEVAGYPDLGQRLLEPDPDLLLAALQNAALQKGVHSIHITCRGIVLHGTLLTEVHQVSVAAYLHAGADDPAELAQRLERWLRYWLDVMKPESLREFQRRSERGLTQLSRSVAYTCTACGRSFTSGR